MILKDGISKPKGKLVMERVCAITGKHIDFTPVCNVVVLGAKFTLLRGIGGDTSTAYHIRRIKLGRDFVNAWLPSSGDLTTDVGDPTKRKIDGFGTDLITELLPDAAAIAALADGKIWIRIVSSDERRKVIAIDGGTQSLTIDFKFDTDLVNEQFEFEIGYSNGDPEAPLDTFDTTNMNVVFDDAAESYAPFTNNFDLVDPKVDFQFTVIGQDVIDYQLPTVVSNINFSSAALHTGNGEVFSYLRFPKIGISPLININFIWTIYYD